MATSVTNPTQTIASGGTYIPPETGFEIQTQKPAVRFLSAAVQPPSQVYITPADVLQINAASSRAQELVTVTWRVLLPTGGIAFNQFTMSVTADRAINIHAENLPEGFLLSMSCKAAVATTRGQTFVRAFLTRGGTGTGQPSYVLLSDYVTTAMAPAHPGGRVLAPTEGPGAPTLYQIGSVTLPSVAFLTVPTNARWRPFAAEWQVTTAAAVGNRFPGANWTATIGTPIYSTAAITSIPGSSSALVVLGGSTSYTDGSSTMHLEIPRNLVLLAGGGVAFVVGGGLAGDTVQNLNLLVEEWLDNV